MSKITHICLCGPFTDGWTYQENLLSKFHKKMGLDVDVICSQFVWDTKGNIVKSEKDNYIDENGANIIRIPSNFNTNIKSKIRFYKGVYKAICESAPDIIFVHGVQGPAISKIVKYAKKHKDVTIYVDNHADFSNSARSWLSKNILHRILWKHYAKKIEPYTEKFYGVLPARVNFLHDVYGIPKEKIELLVMGADDDLVRPAADPSVRHEIRNKHNVDEDDFMIVTGGKIDAFKMQTLLLMEAVKELNNPKVKLIVFGSVSDDIIGKVEDLSDGMIVKYIGWINPNDSYKYFAASDLVVFPGRHSVFWEQVVGQGIPMLVKRWNGTEHVNYCGNVDFIDEDTVDAIKDKLESLIGKEKYETMLENAKKASNEFCYSGIAEKSIKRSVSRN